MNVTVGNVSGAFGDRTATVMGSVYGGGESVPYMKSYTGYADGYFSTQNPDVAAVFGTTSVIILGGADVKGSVYGSGRGISYDGSGKISDADRIEYSTMYLYSYSGSGFAPANVAWMAGGVATYYTSSEKDLSTFAKVEGPFTSDPVSSVTVSGGSVAGSVYGGGAYGITTQSTPIGSVVCTVRITGGTVGDSVYGGGVGVAGKVSVYGGTTVRVSGGTVVKDVFGGARYGIVDYDTRVLMTGGSVNGSVYGGGYGVNGYVSIKGERRISLKNVTIGGSVYGGSSMGDDGSEAEMNARSYVVVSGNVSIAGDVFGGGFQGNTYGMTGVEIGYERVGTPGSVDIIPIADKEGVFITIGGSVYAGGNVGELSEDATPYTSYLVRGGGIVRINGEGLDVSIAGSIMGSGNSCLTAGTTSIAITHLINSVDMEGIHRADYVLIDASSLDLVGRGTPDNFGNTSDFALFGIDRLVMRNASILTIYSAVDDLDRFESLNKDNNPTTVSSPLNALVFGSGNTLYIRDTENGTVAYGDVIGYTAISVNNDTTYGGYAMGSLTSPGGFVLMYGGSYVEADKTDYDNCRCWFIAGSMNISTSMTLIFWNGTGTYADSTSADLEMIKLLENTGMRYTGGVYIESNPNMFSFVSEASSDVNKFRFRIGSSAGPEGDRMLFGGGAGIDFVPGSSDVHVATGNGEDGYLSRYSSLRLEFSGTIENKNQYIGYIMLYFQEVSEIEYATSSGTETSYVITNNIDIRVDLYTASTNPNIAGDFTLSIGTVNGSGSTSFYLPPGMGLSGAAVNITGMTALNGGNDVLGVAAAKNLDNRDGWASKSPVAEFSPGYEGHSPVGTLQGNYSANMVVSVKDSIYSEAMYYKLTAEIVDENNGHTYNIAITVIINSMPEVTVIFVDDQQDYSVTSRFDYGTVLKQSDCPPTRANFIGWYTDNNFNNIYNFKTPLTTELHLYARYTLTVTFNNGDGTSSLMYVAENAGGTRINPPVEPVRNGYVFGGWYRDQNSVVAWDFDNSRVVENTVLYAKWTGVEINVSFEYTKGGETVPLVLDGAEYRYVANYGSKFEALDEAFSLSAGRDVTYLMRARDAVSSSISEEFIRWSADINGSSIAVYDDTVLNFYHTDAEGRYCVVLFAVTSPIALQVRMDVNTQALTAEVTPPSTFLVYPSSTSASTDGYGSYYEFSYGLNGATRTG